MIRYYIFISLYIFLLSVNELDATQIQRLFNVSPFEIREFVSKTLPPLYEVKMSSLILKVGGLDLLGKIFNLKSPGASEYAWPLLSEIYQRRPIPKT